jgi:polyisoprenoid-binding protein YceI
MKTLFLLSFALVSANSFGAGHPKIEAGSYAIDPAHSKVGFEISHLVISTVEGRFDTFTGSVEMGKKIDDTKISASITVDSVSTGNADRDKHLKSPDFFDSAKFSTITFTSKSVSGPEDNLTIKGDLTIRGVTKPITLMGKYTGVVNDPFGNTKVAFNAKGKLSRKDYGLVWNKLVEAGPVVGDEVTLDLRVEAGKPVAKK